MELTIGQIKELNERSEIKWFYQVLAIKHTNSVMRVFNEGEISVEAIVQRAVEETNRLVMDEDTVMESKSPSNKCDPPQIWDAKLKKCVDP